MHVQDGIDHVRGFHMCGKNWTAALKKSFIVSKGLEAFAATMACNGMEVVSVPLGLGKVSE